MKYFLGVDVGTCSARAGLFDETGQLIFFKTHDIDVLNPRPNHYEYSSENIWQSVCACLRSILASLDNINIDDIVSIGFDATCSLVVLDGEFKPVSVSTTNDPNVNVIMWMVSFSNLLTFLQTKSQFTQIIMIFKDHRAHEETEFINSTGHPCLQSVGGKISIEMDPPKILWLKSNLKERCYDKAAHFFSLPDYLVWRCSGVNIRSVCTTTCKWLYKAAESCWDKSFWEAIGLSELTHDNFARIGATVTKPFSAVSDLVITKSNAKSIGLSESLKVGVSLIDAHAGGIGAIVQTMGFKQAEKQTPTLGDLRIEEILVLVSGTSACLMATSRSAKFCEGVWGPYYSAMVPDMWLNEAGQSSCGKLIDTVLKLHPDLTTLIESMLELNPDKDIYDVLYDQLKDQSNSWEEMSQLTKDIHVYPDFHGNRSPLSDPNMTGALCGLGIDYTVQSLALKYLATIQALAYQTEHIIEALNESGVEKFKIIVIIGGLARNKLYTQSMSDVCGLPVLLTDSSDSDVMFGSAISGAAVYLKGSFDDLVNRFSQASNGLNSTLILPTSGGHTRFHEKKYQVYKCMLEDQRKYRSIMNS
jgi:FGGY-family pentulose kinase